MIDRYAFFPMRYLISLSLILIFNTTASAQPTRGPGWSFRFEPYLWAANINGTVEAEGLPADVDLPIIDAINKGNGALAVDFTVQAGDFSVLSELAYTILEDTTPGISGVEFEGARAEFTELFLTEALGYSVVSNEYGFFDIIAGARISSVENVIKYYGGPEGVQELKTSESWADPIVGFNTRTALSDGIDFHGMAEVGGFGAASSLTWQALAGVDIALGPSTALTLKYRALSVDYEKDDFTYDILMHGPTLGVAFLF